MTDVNSKSSETDNSGTQNGIADIKDDDSFGVADGRIDDSALYSSSALNSACGANQARLNNQPIKEKYGAWSPMYNDKNQYLDVDLGDIAQVGSIATQGRPGYDQDGGWFVQSYSLSSSNDGENFTNLREYGISKVFEGNTDPETVVKNTLKTALKCRYLRFRPVTWHNQIALRVEVYKYTGSSGSSRKRSAQQKASNKSTSDRVKSRPAGVRGKEPLPRTEVESKPNASASKQIKQNDEVETESNRIVENMKVQENGNSFEEIGNTEIAQVQKDEISDVVDAKETFEIIEAPNEDKAAMEEQVIESPTETKERKVPDDVVKVAEQPVIDKRNSVRSHADSFETRPGVDHLYSLKMKQASAVSKHSDGSKYIGKIKLIKKEEPPVEDEDVQQPEQKKTIDCEITDGVKQRLTDYQDVVVRKRDSRIDDDSKKLRSVILEDDLKYVNQMEVSMHERLRIFKETESKGKEEIEHSRQEEEKRRLLKQDAEKRRSIALQREQERIQALIQKKKEEEEEKRRQQEISEKEASEEFEEINAEVMTVPAIVSDRRRMFTETEKHEKEKQEALKIEEEKRHSLKREAEKRRSLNAKNEQEHVKVLVHNEQRGEDVQRGQSEVEKSGEFVEIDVDEAITVPAIVSDRLKLFKETEKHQQEKHKLEEIEAEKRKQARISAEKKRLLALEREKEKLQELKRKQKEEEEKRKAEEATREELVKEDFNVEKPAVPAIVRDRLKMFSEGEKAQKQAKEALKQEAEKRKAAKEEAERRRQQRTDDDETQKDVNDNEGRTGNEGEEDIIAVEETMNVESEMSFDFMEDGEEVVQNEENIAKDVETISADEKQRIREAKLKFMQGEKPENVPRAVKQVGKLKNKGIFKGTELEKQEERHVESNGDVMDEESLDLEKKLQGIDTHHDGYDPEQERRMLDEAEAAFRSFKASSKSETRPKRSAKTENLIKSFSVASSHPSEQASKGGRIKMDASGKQQSSQPHLKKTHSFEEEIIEAAASTEVCSAPENFDIQTPGKDELEKQAKPEPLVINTGLVKQRANVFSNPTLPAGDTPKTAHANVKKWIASNPSSNLPQDPSSRKDSSTLELHAEIDATEQRVSELSMRIEQLKLEDKEEEALDVEEEYHAAKLELSKLKRKLLKLQKDGAKSHTRNSSSSSECYSMPDDAFSDRASSSSSRTPRGGSHRTSREVKSFTEKPQPPVDVSAFNDDGEVVGEGTVISQIKTYEDESAKQRKQRAELRKSLSLSHSSLDYLENPPPMGFGGPEFAKDKSKLSKECKMPRGTPVPPVESTAFNDEGDCVPEGNVVEQVKVFSKS